MAIPVRGKRRLSTREASRLQSLPEWFDFGDQRPSDTYKQLGNGVNIAAIWYVLKQAAVKYEDDLRRTAPDLLSAILNAPDNPDQALAKLGKHRPNALADNESTNS